MKTCKNCGTANEAIAVKCICCKIEGQFTLHALTETIEPVVEQATIQCANCGDQQLSEATQCSTCRFPLAKVKVKTIDTLAAKLGKRVG